MFATPGRQALVLLRLYGNPFKDQLSDERARMRIFRRNGLQIYGGLSNLQNIS